MENAEESRGFAYSAASSKSPDFATPSDGEVANPGGSVADFAPSGHYPVVLVEEVVVALLGADPAAWKQAEDSANLVGFCLTTLQLPKAFSDWREDLAWTLGSHKL